MQLIYAPSKISFRVYEEATGIRAGNGIETFAPHEMPRGLEPEMILDLVSDEDKIFLDNRASYFHTILHWLRYVLIHTKSSDKKLTIIFAVGPDHSGQVVQAFSGVTEYLVDKFKKMGHSIAFLDTKYAIVNNFILYEEIHDFEVDSASEVANFLREGLEIPDNPNEKIYLSRGKTTTFNGNANMKDISLLDPRDVDSIVSYRNNNIHKFSNRMDDEKLLEDYFRDLGFAIVYPEDFGSYKEQLTAIASAKILVSITSGGLVASLVMQPETTLVELSTPLEEDSGMFRTHLHYRELADVNRKTYLSIPHSRVAREVISRIESNQPLKTFLSS